VSDVAPILAAGGVERLRGSPAGAAHLPGDPGYDTARAFGHRNAEFLLD